jgi:hypothetical protein
MSVGGGGNLAMVAKTLQLNADGTYTMEGVSSLRATSDGSTASTGAQGGNKGTWSASGYSLTLNEASGKATRSIAFPFDDEKTATYPDQLFFAGIMFSKKN